MNTRNFGLAEGRLVRDPAIFPNADGSRKAKFTLAVQDNFPGKDGKRGSQFINFDGFIRADKGDNGVYGIIHEGDLIAVHYSVRTNNYTDKDGNNIFSQVLQVQEIDMKESKSVTEKRASEKAAKAAGEAMPAPVPAEIPEF